MAQTFPRRAGLLLAGGGVYAGASGLVYLMLTAGQADQEDTDQQIFGCRHINNDDVQQQGQHSGSSSSSSSSNSSNINHHQQQQQQFSFVTNPERTEKFDDIAAKYDFLINNDERIMGMNLMRKALLYWHAKGTVLEMAAGTGRNCSYYSPSSVNRVVLTDTSEQMLQQARAKVFELQRGVDDVKPKFAILQADNGKVDDSVFADNSFDTVVDTFGLCSFEDPVAVLREMERVCKPDGKILLLEHGRSHTWQWITEYLDKTAERHAKNWGCCYNRDVDRMLAESGVRLETMHTWHFGTTYYIVCRPNKNANQKE